MAEASENKDSERITLQSADCCAPVADSSGAACCGGSGPTEMYREGARPWMIGCLETLAGKVPVVSTQLSMRDRLGHWRVRWSVGRMRYAIKPGLYAVGRPTAETPVFVTANYKFSFDHLRSDLHGRDGWIMVLDTKGINVWCAAGKGTFGTQEIIERIGSTRLPELVSHRKLILPQLGAPGVKAHEVKRASGFTVRYGPVRSADLSAWLDSSRHATPEMRRVQFSLSDRLALTPADVVYYGRYALLLTFAMALLSGFGAGIYDLTRVPWQAIRAALPILGGALAGAVLTPALLPWLPGRSFSAKGAWAGGLYLLVLAGIAFWNPSLRPNWSDLAAWLFLIPAVASFVGMNFTGSSTYTSLSGVRKEMSCSGSWRGLYDRAEILAGRCNA
jgi:hypothetical protein